MGGCARGREWARGAVDKRFDAFFTLAAGKENAPSTSVADKTDVGAEPHHGPLVTAARVRLAQADDVRQSEVEGHTSTDYTTHPAIVLERSGREKESARARETNEASAMFWRGERRLIKIKCAIMGE